MGVTSPLSLPYPEPTDPVAQGATAVRNLAEAVDDKLTPLRAVRQYITNPHVSGPNNAQNMEVDPAAVLAPALVTGWAQITCVGEVYCGAATGFTLVFETPGATTFPYSAHVPNSRVNVPSYGGPVNAGAWFSYHSTTMWAPITATLKPWFRVQVFAGSPNAGWYVSMCMNVLEIAN